MKNLFFQRISLPFVISLGIFALVLFFYSQTPQWFFFWSTKEQVDFNNTSGEFDPQGTFAYFNGTSVHVPGPFFEKKFASNVLGESTGQKRVEVDLTNQRLYAFEGDNKVFDFAISSGKWGLTPTGTFYPWIKLRYTRMKGGNKAFGTFYDLPNVPHTIFFYNDQVPKWKGFALHGAYWHNNFGHPMSHGCVNVGLADMEKLYYWMDPPLNGKSSLTISANDPVTPIVIYGETPKS